MERFSFYMTLSILLFGVTLIMVGTAAVVLDILSGGRFLLLLGI